MVPGYRIRASTQRYRPSRSPVGRAAEEADALERREAYIREFEVSLAKWESDGTAPPVILLGLPGVGKSALLNRFGDIASNRGWTTGR